MSDNIVKALEQIAEVLERSAKTAQGILELQEKHYLLTRELLAIRRAECDAHNRAASAVQEKAGRRWWRLWR